MSTIDKINEQFNRTNGRGSDLLQILEKKAFEDFKKLGIPTVRNEEWKYSRVGSVLNKEYEFNPSTKNLVFNKEDLNALHLPDHKNANIIVFINGIYSNELSSITSSSLICLPLKEAASSEFSQIVENNLGHSRHYLKDGINALSTSFISGGIFLHVPAEKRIEKPLYIYNIIDSRNTNVLAQPRSLIHIDRNAFIQIVETYSTVGSNDHFSNQVMEVVMENGANVEYYKIENNSKNASLVSTTHFRQVGKSFLHSVVISLNGAFIRNNTNVILEAEHCEAHLYGLYFHNGQSHIDNHTIVDNTQPNCFSNELYKGILDDQASGVFNGKIYVQRDAQKTNAYQSNKNILLSESATVNTKPQLEIFADDVKCSHGCTIGKLDEEGLFYLQSRGIEKKVARSLLLYAFAIDVLKHIKPEPIRKYVNELIAGRLEFEIE